MPYMRVTRSQYDSAAEAELTRLAQDLAAAYQRLPGFQHAHGGIDRAGGRGVTVLLFDTREHADFAPEALGEVLARLQAVGVRIETREVYEVTV